MQGGGAAHAHLCRQQQQLSLQALLLRHQLLQQRDGHFNRVVAWLICHCHCCCRCCLHRPAQGVEQGRAPAASSSRHAGWWQAGRQGVQAGGIGRGAGRHFGGAPSLLGQHQGAAVHELHLQSGRGQQRNQPCCSLAQQAKQSCVLQAVRHGWRQRAHVGLTLNSRVAISSLASDQPLLMHNWLYFSTAALRTARSRPNDCSHQCRQGVGWCRQGLAGPSKCRAGTSVKWGRWWAAAFTMDSFFPL